MPQNNRRQSLRLTGYDYSNAGAYYITIVTHLRVPLFGHNHADEMLINDVGLMIQRVWENLPTRFPGIEMDIYTVMPNHFHGILIRHEVKDNSSPGQSNFALGDIVGAFKSLTTDQYIKGVKALGWTRFTGKIWQRNYFEHIIRNQDDYERISNYIALNPIHWSEDEENPDRISPTP